MHGYPTSNFGYEIAKKFFSYNPSTGLIVWIKTNSNRAKAGSEAGNHNKSKSRKSYLHTSLNGKRMANHNLAHLLMTGDIPEGVIDHINGNGLDNRWSNLRVISRQENHQNQRLREDNTTGCTGVYWRKDRAAWRAIIYVDSKPKYLGIFKVFEDAVKARKEAEIKYGFHENHGSCRPL